MNKILAAFVCGIALVVSGWNSPSSAQQPQPTQPPKYSAVLTVKHMCCAKESVPAIRELSKIPGVKRVSVDYKTRSLYIEKGDVSPSAQGIWDAAARIQVEPLRLATTEGVYTSRPVR